MAIELKKIGKEIGKLYSDKKINYFKIVKAFNPMIEHLVSIFKLNGNQRKKLKIFGTITAAKLVIDEKIDSDKFFALMEDTLINKVAEKDVIDDDDDLVYKPKDNNDFGNESEEDDDFKLKTEEMVHRLNKLSKSLQAVTA